MGKNVLRLTEGDLYQIVKESVNRILMNEWNGSDELEKDEYRARNSLDDDEETVEEGVGFQNNQGYSHFAVNKATNKIVNGWDYSSYDPSELRQFKNDYFNCDLVDNDLDPKQYKIVTGKYLLRQGIDPNDNNNWANS